MCTLRSCAKSRSPRLHETLFTPADVDPLPISHVLELLVHQLHALDAEEAEGPLAVGPVAVAELLGLVSLHGLMQRMRE